MTPTELAQKSGAQQPNIFRIIQGEVSEPRDNTIQPLADYWGVSVHDLRYNDLTCGLTIEEKLAQRHLVSQAMMQGKPVDDSLVSEYHLTETDLFTKPIHTKKHEIPVLDVSGSMGNGFLQPENDAIITRMTVTAEWIRRNVSVSNPECLALISAYGDSMEGTFNDGDLLLVDRCVSDIKIDAVYVLALNDELYIKRLQRRPDGSVLMISDNKKYEPYTIKNGEREKFQVLGRVLLAWNSRKL